MPKTALVVDDATVVRQLSAMTLRRAGLDVIEAVNGKDALKKVEGVKLDLVVTDLNMPEMDGLELITQLRHKPEYRFTPIVVLSTVSQEEQVKHGRELGASGWVYKPFNATKLMEVVRKFL